MVQHNRVNSSLFRAFQKTASSLISVPQFLSLSEDVYSPPSSGEPVDSHYPPGNHYGTTAKIATHTVTHTPKKAYGNNGNNRSGKHVGVKRKGLKTLVYQRLDAPDSLCNQQVGGSSPSTSSIV